MFQHNISELVLCTHHIFSLYTLEGCACCSINSIYLSILTMLQRFSSWLLKLPSCPTQAFHPNSRTPALLDNTLLCLVMFKGAAPPHVLLNIFCIGSSALQLPLLGLSISYGTSNHMTCKKVEFTPTPSPHPTPSPILSLEWYIISIEVSLLNYGCSVSLITHFKHTNLKFQKHSEQRSTSITVPTFAWLAVTC